MQKKYFITIKKLSSFLLLCLFSLFLFSCRKDIEVSQVTVSGASSLQQNETAQYTATILPNDAKDKNVEWSVEKVDGDAKINEYGVLTGKSVGRVKVVATSKNGKSGSLTVTIKQGKIPVESVTINGAENVAMGTTATYFAQILPIDATEITVSWSITPGTGDATISETGVLTPLAVGTITLTALVDGMPATKSITIIPEVINLESVSIVGPDEISEFDEELLSFTINPANASYSNFTWSVTNGTGTATISPAGLLIANTPGTITVKIEVDGIIGIKEYTIKSLPNLVTDFVRAEGGYFYEGDSNEPFRFQGSNNYNLHYKSDAMIDDVFKQAADMGLKVMRMWAFFDGWEDEGRANYAYGQIRPGVYNKTPVEQWGEGETLYDRNTGEVKDPVHILDRVDYAIRRAGQYGIRLVLVLTNYYPEFGGMQTYVNWYNGLNPGENLSKTAFYTNETIKTWYKNWVAHVVGRTNKLTGVPYIEDPTIFSWELANEPDGAQVDEWAAEMSAYLKNDLKVPQMVTAGAQGYLGSVPNNLVINSTTSTHITDDFNYTFTRGAAGITGTAYGTGMDQNALLQISTLDYTTAHLYVDHWGINKDIAIEYGKKFIEDSCAVARYYGKPFVLEEYGIMRASMSESMKINRDLAMDVWNQALYDMGGAGSMFWILTGIEDSPDADADGNYPDFDGFRILNDGGSTSQLIKKYSQLFNGEISEIQRESKAYLLNPLISQITKNGTFAVQVKVVPEGKTVDRVDLLVHNSTIRTMNYKTEAHRVGVYESILNMNSIEPGEQYTIKAIVYFTDGTQVQTEPRTIRRYIELDLDLLYDLDFSADKQVNYQTFGSYEGTLISPPIHNKQLEMMEINVEFKNVNWSEHKIKFIALPKTTSGLPIVPNTFRLSYTTYYNKNLIDSKTGGTIKNYIALEPGWVKTGIDQNNLNFSILRGLSGEEANTEKYGIRWIDLDGDGLRAADGSELFYYYKVTLEFEPSESLNAVAINPTCGGIAYTGIIFIDDIQFYGYQDGAPIDKLEPDDDFEFTIIEE